MGSYGNVEAGKPHPCDEGDRTGSLAYHAGCGLEEEARWFEDRKLRSLGSLAIELVYDDEGNTVVGLDEDTVVRVLGYANGLTFNLTEESHEVQHPIL